MAFGRRKSKIEGSPSVGADDASAVTLERKPSRFSLFGGRNKKNKQSATTAPVQDRDEVDEDDLYFTDGNQSGSVATAFKNRKNQKKIVYDHFGDFAKDVLMTWSTSEIPKAENVYDVVVKIEVSIRRLHHIEYVMLSGVWTYDLTVDCVPNPSKPSHHLHHSFVT
jgi:hypothetical protein